MAQDEGKKDEEKLEFTLEGETPGYISLDQARVLAMRTAREAPGAYGRRFRNVPMAFEVAEDEETEDHYVVTLSFRPEGEFTGTPGQEQFFIEKTGTVEVRQVLSLPRLAEVRRFPVVPVGIGLLAVVIAVVLVVVFAVGGGGRGGDQIPVVSALPTEPLPTTVTLVPEAVALPTATPRPSSTSPPALAPTPPATQVTVTILPTPAPGTLPVVVFQNGLVIEEFGPGRYSGVEDTYIAEDAPSTKFVAETSLYSQIDPTGQVLASEVLIRFDLSTLSSDILIKQAILSLHRHPNHFDAGGTFRALEITSPLALRQVTWNNFDRRIIGDSIGQFTIEPLSIYAGSWHEMDITDAVRRWIASPAQNHGFILEKLPGTEFTLEMAFFSADYTSDGTPGGKALTPKLTIDFGASPQPTTTPTPTPTPSPTPIPPTLIPKPTNGRITFMRYNEIYVMNADRTNVPPLTANSAIDQSPAWNPSGSRIAFNSNRHGNHEIYVMDANGSNQVRLTNITYREESPAWSPDGSRIAFRSERDLNWDIYFINSHRPAIGVRGTSGKYVVQTTMGT